MRDLLLYSFNYINISYHCKNKTNVHSNGYIIIVHFNKGSMQSSNWQDCKNLFAIYWKQIISRIICMNNSRSLQTNEARNFRYFLFASLHL